MKYTINIEGHPRPQSRPRLGRFRVYSSGTNASEWRDMVAVQAGPQARMQKAVSLDGPLTIHTTFIFQRPKSHFKVSGTIKDQFKDPRCWTALGDLDNLAKAVWDALEKKGIITNDALICDAMLSKRWAARNQVPGVLIEIWDDKRNPDGEMIPEIQKGNTA